MDRSERFVVLYADADMRLLSASAYSDGGVSGVRARVGGLVRHAVLCGSATIIFVHNHPSGDARASIADISSTIASEVILRAAGIRLVDHIIVARGEWSSMAADGFL